MQQGRIKRSYLGLMIIFGVLAILTFILMAVVAIIFLTRQPGRNRAITFNPLLGVSPLTQLNIEQIDPALALATLGGVAEEDVIAEAIVKSRPETALSGLLFGATLSNRASAGGFLQVGEAYARQQNVDSAAFSYNMACIVATLAPDIPDTVRADIFLQAGEGFADINNPSLARHCLDQAFEIALNSPYLQAAHRRVIFEKLQQDYLALNERELARESLNLSANPPRLALMTAERKILPKVEPVPLPLHIQEAEATRWLAAQELAIHLVELGGNVVAEEVDQLAEALITEDQLKQPYYQQEIVNATQLSKKIDVTIAKINWLTIKYKVARKGFGLSIVPEWEAQAEQIRADLTKSYESLFPLYADIIIALPELSQIDKATEEKLRHEVLVGELGRYPNYPEEQRKAQLLSATQQLINTQPELKLFIGTTTVADQEKYRLISVE